MILVVDDNRELLRGLCDILTSKGNKVMGASDGEEALATYSNAPKLFKLIITDLKMPKMSGFELIEKVLAKGYAGPIIVLSGFLDAEAQEKLQNLKVAEILPKPFKLDELCRLVANHLK